MAVRREDDAFGVDGRNARTDLGEHVAVFFGGRVADGVWHVDGGCAGLNSNADHLDKEIAVGASGVFRGELDIFDMGAGETDGFGGEVEGLLASDLELVLEVQIARCEEDVDAGAVGELQGAHGHLDVFGFCASQ